MESDNVYIALFLHQGLDIYLYCEYHDGQFFVLVINLAIRLVQFVFITAKKAVHSLGLFRVTGPCPIGLLANLQKRIL